MAKILAIVNQKGGVGKTTTAVNLGACLAAKLKRVLIVDIDPQGNTTSGLGIDKSKVKHSVYDVILGNIDMQDAVSPTDVHNLYICISGQELAGAEIELVSEKQREHRLKNAIDTIADKYDYILIDCPPAIGLVTLNALVCAHAVIIPIQCEYYALEGLGYLINTIKHVRKLLNPSLDIEGVLLTMFDARTNLSIQVAEEVKKCFPKKVYSTIIPRNIRLSEAPSHGMPIIKYDPSSKGAEAYMKLADEMIQA